MMSFAQITLIGHVGRDPELTYTPEGVAVTRFSLAISKKEGKEGKEKTTWFNCTAFRGPAETIHQYVAKGSPLFVQGDLNVREYTGKDGQLHTNMDVLVDKFQLIGNKSTTSMQEESPSKGGVPF
jgi:single-strand DNA-binding protein